MRGRGRVQVGVDGRGGRRPTPRRTETRQHGGNIVLHREGASCKVRVRWGNNLGRCGGEGLFEL
jgi:hypothetical protein